MQDRPAGQAPANAMPVSFKFQFTWPIRHLVGHLALQIPARRRLRKLGFERPGSSETRPRTYDDSQSHSSGRPDDSPSDAPSRPRSRLLLRFHPTTQNHHRRHLVDHLLAVAPVMSRFIKNLVRRHRAQPLIPKLHRQPRKRPQLRSKRLHLRRTRPRRTGGPFKPSVGLSGVSGRMGSPDPTSQERDVRHPH
jgi:hypothetical protein